MVNGYIRETVFVGENYGSIGYYGNNAIKQSYSVGSSSKLISANGNELKQIDDS